MSAVSVKKSRSAGLQSVVAAATVLAGGLVVTLHGLSVLRDARLAHGLLSDGLWKRVVAVLEGTAVGLGEAAVARIDSPALLTLVSVWSLVAWFGGAALIAWRRRIPYLRALPLWGKRGWIWWLLPLAWEGLDVLARLCDQQALVALLIAALPFWHGLMWAGWLTTGFTLARRPEEHLRPPSAEVRVPPVVWGAIAAYAVVFSAMNCALFESLLVPHGDSAMYEEHIWNFLHGKGFRSYLDANRPFLGEHVQVIHLAAIPIYLLWPSHLLLELCQSLALALGAIPLYRIACRHGGSTRAAAALAIAYLLYVPLQNLDIAVDFKTFRPNSFEIPLFLAAFEALEMRRWRMFFITLVLALLCQEDAATIIAPLGAWMALCGTKAMPGEIQNPKSKTQNRSFRLVGAALTLFGVLYLILVIKVVLPYFRNGEDVHFAKYFPELGGSSNSIFETVFRHPELVLRRLVDVESIGFALALLAPLGFLPFLSPGRLAVAAPLFGVLCLSEITNSPLHHFHAPLIPVLMWAAAAGLGNVERIGDALSRVWRRLWRIPPPPEESRRIAPERFASSGKSLTADPAPPVFIAEPQPVPAPPPRDRSRVEVAATWSLLSSFCVGFFLGLSPACLGFWDPDSMAYWRNQYVPGERARQFPKVLAQIPVESRVASTDFVHPRFTHHARSYDYSDYRPIVPDDTDYIVIDTRHPYSRIRRPNEIKEYRDHPEAWELIPDSTDGYFIVLKRIRGAATQADR